jgi:hypothetical protein
MTGTPKPLTYTAGEAWLAQGSWEAMKRFYFHVRCHGEMLSKDELGLHFSDVVIAYNAYVDGPALQGCWATVLIGSLAFICPASITAVAHDRRPRWVPRRKFQTALRPVAAIGVSGASHVSDRPITPSARSLQVPASAQHEPVEGAAVLADALDGLGSPKRA